MKNKCEIIGSTAKTLTINVNLGPIKPLDIEEVGRICDISKNEIQNNNIETQDNNTKTQKPETFYCTDCKYFKIGSKTELDESNNNEEIPVYCCIFNNKEIPLINETKLSEQDYLHECPKDCGLHYGFAVSGYSDILSGSGSVFGGNAISAFNPLNTAIQETKVLLQKGIERALGPGNYRVISWDYDCSTLIYRVKFDDGTGFETFIDLCIDSLRDIL